MDGKIPFLMAIHYLIGDDESSSNTISFGEEDIEWQSRSVGSLLKSD